MYERLIGVFRGTRDYKILFSSKKQLTFFELVGLRSVERKGKLETNGWGCTPLKLPAAANTSRPNTRRLSFSEKRLN